VPRDFAARVPAELRATLADAPGSHQGTQSSRQMSGPDRLARLRSDYCAAGGLPDNLRRGWVARG
jgi:hypothetical protein